MYKVLTKISVGVKNTTHKQVKPSFQNKGGLARPAQNSEYNKLTRGEESYKLSRDRDRMYTCKNGGWNDTEPMTVSFYILCIGGLPLGAV
jgi:hypothetical protein